MRNTHINEVQPGKPKLGVLQYNKLHSDRLKTQKLQFKNLQPIKQQYEELHPKMQNSKTQERKKHQHEESEPDKFHPRHSQPIGPKSNKPSHNKPYPKQQLKKSQFEESHPEPSKATLHLPRRHLTPNEVKRLVDDAMEILKEERPDDYALLYELYFNGTSLHALSRTLHIPRSTLRSRRKKALLHLKTIIGDSKK